MPRSTTRATKEAHYPESDGKPMGETGIHVDATIDLHVMIRDVIFAGRPDVYLTSDMFFYYEEGNPRAVKAPDLMVIKGVADRTPRRTYKLWIEKLLPCLIFEITSAETKRDDLVVKRELYARLGVHEYFLFDPLGDYLAPPFRGLRLREGRYEPIKPDEDGMLESIELGVKLRPAGFTLRMYDLATGRLILNMAERAARGDRADALERSLDAERAHAEAERRRADAERAHAEAEGRRANSLEAELNRLRALLGEGGEPPAA